jgi:hypothetical protein
MTVNFLGAAGARVTTSSFKPGPNQMIKINGKDTKSHDLHVGLSDAGFDRGFLGSTAAHQALIRESVARIRRHCAPDPQCE